MQNMVCLEKKKGNYTVFKMMGKIYVCNKNREFKNS